jgi:hypothetical protein
MENAKEMVALAQKLKANHSNKEENDVPISFLVFLVVSRELEVYLQSPALILISVSTFYIQSSERWLSFVHTRIG